jgi:hypothetical protein
MERWVGLEDSAHPTRENIAYQEQSMTLAKLERDVRFLKIYAAVVTIIAAVEFHDETGKVTDRLPTDGSKTAK